MTGGIGTSWQLLRRSPSIVLPAMGVGLACGAVAHILASRGLASFGFFGDLDAQGDGAFYAFLWTIVGLAWYMLGTMLMVAVTTGMAHAAWTSESTVLADSLAPFRRSGPQFLGLLAILISLDIVAATLVIPTFALSIPAFMASFVYAIPGTLLDHRTGVDALVRSIGVAWRAFGVTFGTIAGLLLLALAGSSIGLLAGPLPLGMKLAGWTVLGAATAFATVVLIGVYEAQSERPLGVPPSAT
jgi:hypothetical protein